MQEFTPTGDQYIKTYILEKYKPAQLVPRGQYYYNDPSISGLPESDEQNLDHFKYWPDIPGVITIVSRTPMYFMSDPNISPGTPISVQQRDLTPSREGAGKHALQIPAYSRARRHAHGESISPNNQESHLDLFAGPSSSVSALCKMSEVLVYLVPTNMLYRIRGTSQGEISMAAMSCTGRSGLHCQFLGAIRKS